ncbi:MAG: hypothetical protein PHO26_08540, partial [Dehalococcoidia bacterium]|nr:hypothetical protein [Dehalococcoidia bacterium]
MRIFRRALPLAIILSLLAVFLPQIKPAYALTQYIWETQAAFEACLLNNVDTTTNPDAVMLAVSTDVGDGSYGDLTVSSTVYTDNNRAAINQQSNAGSNVVYVADTTGFFSSQEILVIQMSGTDAGKWETKYVQSVGAGQLVLTANLQNTYYTGGSNHAQVTEIPHWNNVTVNSGGQIQCHAWDGSTGGIVIFRARGTVDVNGNLGISANAKGFGGGNGGSGGSGGGGGNGGDGAWSPYRDGDDGGESGTGGEGGNSGCGCCGDGGDGARRGHDGGNGSSGSSGAGPAAGGSSQGGGNGSSNDMALLQIGSGGGGGSGGDGGY